MKPTPKPIPPVKLQFSFPIEVAEHPEAKAELVRVLKLLHGKVDDRDKSLLIDYAMTHAEIINLRMLIGDDYTLTGAKGGEYTNPLVNIMAGKQSHLASLRRDLYFTPKTRVEKKNNATKTKTQGIRDTLDKGGDDDES